MLNQFKRHQVTVEGPGQKTLPGGGEVENLTNYHLDQ